MISGTEANLLGEAHDYHPQFLASPLGTPGTMVQIWRPKERKDGLNFSTQAFLWSSIKTLSIFQLSFFLS